MIDFEEELKKFKPSLEIDDTEAAILEDEKNDMVDLMIRMMNDRHDHH